MDEEITYGVFWKSSFCTNEFRLFSGWYTKYDDACKCYQDLKGSNPLCIEARIVEKCEHYEVVATTEAAP